MARQRRKKRKSKQGGTTTESENSDLTKAPHSFVFHRGLVGRNIKQLVVDMRRVMEPYTASNLKVHKKNVLKDFLSVSGLLGVSHIIVFTKTEAGINLKVSRLPRGPTLTFKVNSYCLNKDIVSSLKHHSMYSGQFKQHPLLVLNNFAREGLHVKLMATMFQNMFPSINVNRVKLNSIRRCVLLNFNPETNLIDFRHYSIKVVPIGMSRGIKKLIQTRIPNMSRYSDVSEYLLKQLKEKRRKLQENNVKRKQTEKEKHKIKTIAGMERKKEMENDEDSDVEGPTADVSSEEDVADDAEWFRREVGEEPDPDSFPSQSRKPPPKRKLTTERSGGPWKKAKREEKPTAKLEDKRKWKVETKQKSKSGPVKVLGKFSKKVNPKDKRQFQKGKQSKKTDKKMSNVHKKKQSHVKKSSQSHKTKRKR
uniref:Suppressor of SWI4 1 homolog n=1 Tax=Saccoglossus kowalevskii TaxID=10224 RepID=A0ABM0MCI5_SACKO|nr:PREDICTED: suppressor of SWI4 1 homolog [Saccoglossus kowalevskii]